MGNERDSEGLSSAGGQAQQQQPRRQLRGRNVRFRDETEITAHQAPEHVDLTELIESGDVWYTAPEIQRLQIEDLQQAAQNQRNARLRQTGGQTGTVTSSDNSNNEWTMRGLECLSREFQNSRERFEKDRRAIIMAYKRQQKERPEGEPVDWEEIKDLYQSLTQKELERAIGYGKYDAAQAGIITQTNHHHRIQKKRESTKSAWKKLKEYLKK